MNSPILIFSSPLAAISSLNMSVLPVAPCSLVDIDWRFEGSYCFLHHSYIGSSKSFWNVGQYLPDYAEKIPEDSHLHTCRHESLKFHHFVIRDSRTVINSVGGTSLNKARSKWIGISALSQRIVSSVCDIKW
jgi:hypothetical protein